MYAVLFLGFTAFLLALVLTPLVRDFCSRRGWLDQPDAGRKKHLDTVPRAGGVAVLGAYVGAFAILLLGVFGAGQMLRTAAPEWWGLLPAALLVAGIGLMDDLLAVKPWHKLAVQAVAASAAFFVGVQISSMGGYSFPTWLSFLITVFWLVGCSNAFNLIDGVDGLAAGAALFATVTILVGALLEENLALAMATVPLVGALLGFLRYNFNPASIFLGDSGSLTVGYLLGCYAVIWGQTSATVLGMTAPLMALAIPLLDTAIAIVRRLIRGQGIFTADASHIHHKLLSRGMSPRKVAILLYMACGIAATLALLASVTDGEYKGVIIVLFCGAAWMGVQHLGYVEFGVVGRVLTSGAVRRHLVAQMTLDGFQSSVRAAATPGQCWQAVERAAHDFGYDRVVAVLAGKSFRSSPRGGEQMGESPKLWSVRIPLSGGDYVNLDRFSVSGSALDRVGPFADTIHRALHGRFESTEQADNDDSMAAAGAEFGSRSEKGRAV